MHTAIKQWELVIAQGVSICFQNIKGTLVKHNTAVMTTKCNKYVL